MPGNFFHFLQSFDEVQDYLTYIEEEDPSYVPEDEGDEMYSGDESEDESDSFDESDEDDPDFDPEIPEHDIIAQSGYVNEQEPMEQRDGDEIAGENSGEATRSRESWITERPSVRGRNIFVEESFTGSSGNAAMVRALDSAERPFTDEVLSAVEEPFGVGQSGAINQREGGGLSSTMEFVIVGESAERRRDTPAAPSEVMVDPDTSSAEYETDCPICYNSWDDDGPHQSCSLSCGHTFGRSCIEKWIRDRKKAICPNCKKRCKLSDIRPIYPKRIAVIDSVLKKKVESLDEENKRLKRQIQEKDSMLEATQKELEESRRQMVVSLSDSVPLVETQRKLFHFGDGRKDCEIEYISQSSTRNLLKFVGKQEFRIDGARVFDLVSSEQIILLARRVSSGESVLTKMSLLFPNENENIKLPPCYKAIRDISVSHSIEKLALLASMGNKLSIVSWKSNNIVLQYDLPAPAWSCAWDLNGLHQVYAGLQNGMLMVFDLRQTRTHLHTLSGLSCHPVHTLHCLRGNEAHNAPSGRTALLSASACGLCQWTESGPCRIPNLENQGVCISLAYCGNSENIVATFRPKVHFFHDQNSQPSASTTPGSPVLGSHFHLKRRDTNSYQNLGHVSAYVSEVRMPKSSVISLMDSNPLFAHGNEVKTKCKFSPSLVDEVMEKSIAIIPIS
ncbi:hypothetical protein H6P81_017678 [Aristolochia fimbriata]|uniref:RING-type E3 ubiquitin transferase n=1 Tax=Aristolochia fimbriata TaxID=158543 RepID=A0AAV7DZW0_ARIFI|nr:hypothetical protein H6P81_017678 [Aristolochia fimbriata]